jgi:hypothetical protein
MNTIFHFFDEKTGYYTGSAPAPINPLTGVDAAPNPAVVYVGELPDFDASTQSLRRAGQGVVQVVPKPKDLEPEQPEQTLEQLRARATGLVNDWRQWKERQDIVFEHAGRTWDGGLTTRQRLKPVLSLSQLPDGFFWTDRENNDVPVTLSDLISLAAAHEESLVFAGFAIHTAQRRLKTEIGSMSREELDEFILDGPESRM